MEMVKQSMSLYLLERIDDMASIKGIREGLFLL